MSQVNVLTPDENEDFDVQTGAPTSNAESIFDDKAANSEEVVSETSVEDTLPTVEAPLEPELAEEQTPETTPVNEALSKSSFPKPSVRSAGELVLALLVVGLGAWSAQLYSDRQSISHQLSKLNSNPQIVAQLQSENLITKVGSLVTLPTGETPTVANVSDASKAKLQSAFFNNAQNDDKVLMYVKAGEAILYRPSTNKVILVAPLTFSNTETQAKQ